MNNNANQNSNRTDAAELRKQWYSELERTLDTKFLSFVTGDRMGLEAQIATDCISPFVETLDTIGPTDRVTLMLYTRGGDTLVAWRLINLIRMYCEQLTVLVFSQALSAGTLIAIGADNILMTRHAVLGPIDPSIQTLLNPQVEIRGQRTLVPVSVESVRGYIEAAREELNITDSEQLTTVLVNLASHIHPFVLGSIFRSQSQIRFLARKLLSQQIDNAAKIESVIKFLCADSGSHDYTINRKEAIELGLKVDKPSDEVYGLLRKIHQSFMAELKVTEPFSPLSIFPRESVSECARYSVPRAIIESIDGGTYNYVSEGMVQLVEIPGESIRQGINDERDYEGWRKQP